MQARNILKTPKWLLLSFLAAIFILVGLRAFTRAGLWVAEADRPGKAEVIVCLDGTERIKKAAELYHQGLAPKVILTAGKDKKDLVQLGIPENRITLAEWPTTTYQEALAVKSMVHPSGMRSAIVVSDPYHLKRVRWTFRQVLKDAPVKWYFVSSDMPWDGRGWWREGQTRVVVALEISKMAYYRVVHGLMGLDDDPPWTLALKRSYERLLIKWLA
jgi:uncharacterized SAM-binding protein YcdF (DUF218 family)